MKGTIGTAILISIALLVYAFFIYTFEGACIISEGFVYNETDPVDYNETQINSGNYVMNARQLFNLLSPFNSNCDSIFFIWLKIPFYLAFAFVIYYILHPLK